MKTFNQLKKKLYPEQPSSNGFPDNPPPKMINGWHPSLVDGKFVSNRFNRLDPVSAKAMPLTGNSHIDKKIKLARKQKKDFNYNIFPHSKKINKSSIHEKKYDWRNKIKEEIVLNAKGIISSPVIFEGMTSKGFEYLYGLQVSSIFVPGVHGIQSTIASDILQASSDTTDHRFGPEFPGSYVNTLGDNPISSYSKVDAVAFLDVTYGNVTTAENSFTLTTGPEESLPVGGFLSDPGSVVSRQDLQNALGIVLPSGINGLLSGTPKEGSAVQRIFSNAEPDGTISFDWNFNSDEGIDGEVSVDDYVFIAVKNGDVTKIVSVLQNSIFQEYPFAASGSFTYSVQDFDIVDGKLEFIIGIVDVNDVYRQSSVEITNFTTSWDEESSGSISAYPAGSTKQTTDAYDLGMSVDAADPNKKKKTSTKSLPKSSNGAKDDKRGSNSINPNLIGRTLRSVTDPLRYSGKTMYQGNPAGRSPGLSNYWSPDPRTAGTYTNPGKLKGIPGSAPNPSGTFTQAPRPSNVPKVTRSVLGQPQFKFPAGSPPPANMITNVADNVAVNSAAKAASKTSAILGKAVPFLGIGIAAADAGYRASQGDYMGAVLSGVSAIPGPLGWAALALQVATDATGKTGVRKESYNNYDEYMSDVAKIVKDKNINLDRNGLLSSFLRQFASDKKINDNDKAMLVAIIQGNTDKINKKDIVDFVKRLQKY
jgi:hypothetical protein